VSSATCPELAPNCKGLQRVLSGEVKLFRPVGQAELDLIAATGYRRFPPRLEIQPIFYPVLTFEYARKIAEGWNARDEGVGYVTEFEVDDAFASRYPVQEAGGRECQELWVPAEDLEDFNDHIIGEIKVVAEYHRPSVH
jgi:hypothetical protein